MDIEELNDDELINEYNIVVRELQNRNFNVKLQLISKNNEVE